jgi:hypothetical protein
MAISTFETLPKKGFKDLPDYFKWPKVADAVIEAEIR